LFVAGTVGVVGTVVLAVRATMQMDQVLENHEKQVGWISEEAGTEQISHEEGDRQIRKVQLKTGLQIFKLYAPAVGVGALSILALTGSHVILTKRNAAAIAAYMGLDRAYKELRQRIVNEYGEDTLLKLEGGEVVVIEEKTSDGKTKVTTKVVPGALGISPYRFLFDEQSRFFTKQPGGNRDILMMKQSWANEKLRANGHLFLNEVLDLLGLPRTEAGQAVGWVYFDDYTRDKRIEAGKQVGDNYVSFGIFENDAELVESFLDGAERTVWLDMNVDGMITKILFGKEN